MGSVTYPRRTIDGRTVWACCESSIGPACEHRGAELAAIAEAFPMRDSRGYVTAFYVYARGINSRRVSGPHATLEDAEAARDSTQTLDVLAIICGHVFTERGTIVRAG